MWFSNRTPSTSLTAISRATWTSNPPRTARPQTGGDLHSEERETEVGGHSVLEFAGPIVLDEETTAFLRLGIKARRTAPG